jgi:L-Ala-D/L-Glu epimerase / N-acetyl-D-glutamate racemase
MQVEFRRVDWPYVSPFRISYKVSSVAETVQVQLTEGEFVGRGEALGVSYHGETIASMLAQLESVKSALLSGISRPELAKLLPPGGARCALDCALWDLEAKRSGKRAWELAGLASVKSITSDYTLSLDSPKNMAQAAAAVRQYSMLKLKLAGEGDLERVRAVRAVRPDAELTVDANQAWNERQLREFTPKLAELGVRLIEQPLRVGADDALLSFESPVPICADESCQTAESLAQLAGKYQYVNIKLDKTGGLTEALHLARAAERQGFKLMVGCMAGSSLSMAPAFIVGQICDFVDLDGPLLASADIAHPIRYEGGRMSAPERTLWG